MATLNATDRTAKAESAQALFCALADYAILNGGKRRVKEVFDPKFLGNYEVFSKFWNNLYKNTSIETIYNSHIDTGGTSFRAIEEFLNKEQDWYISSVLIAAKVVTDIDEVLVNFKGIKRPKASEVWFVRGDKPVMDNISKLFSAANKTQKSLNSIKGAKQGQVFSDLNKWSPADIYFSSDKARGVIEEAHRKNSGKDSVYTFDELNSMVSNLIESGELLPLSLKIQTKTVVLKKVNFDRKHELKEAEQVGYYGTAPFKKWSPQNPVARNLTIYVNPRKDYIVVRHDPSTNVFKAEFQIKGDPARGGGASSPEIWYGILEKVDPTFASKYRKEIETTLKAFKEKLKGLGAKPPDGSKEKKAWAAVREEYSSLDVSNHLLPMLLAWMEKDKEKASKFVRMMYLYTTSRSEESSKFVIAK